MKAWETPIYTCGASFGALHSMNLFLKRPDIINGVIAMSGVYDLTEYTKGFYDDQVYFNSPCHYIPNLTDHNYLEQIRASNHIHILTGFRCMGTRLEARLAYLASNVTTTFINFLT